MVSKDHLDHMEQEFRSRFEEPPYDIPQSWNTPSDAVWDNISAEIQTKKRRRRYLWFFLLLLPLGLFVSKQFLNADGTEKSAAQATVNSVEAKNVSVSNHGVKEATPESKILNSSKIEKSSSQSLHALTENAQQSKNKENAEVDELVYKSSLLQSNNQSGSIFIQTDLRDFFSSSVSESTNSKQYYRPLAAATQFSKNFVTNDAQAKVDFKQTVSVEFINGMYSFIDLDEKPKISLTEKEVSLPENEANKKQISYGFLSGVFTPRASVSQAYDNLLEPFDFYYQDKISYQVGGFLSLPITNKIELETGLQFRQSRLKTGHNSSIVYDQSSEQLIDDISFSAYESNFATSFGVVEANLVLARNQAATINAEEFTVDINMNQNINQITLPVKPKLLVLESESLGVKVNPSFNLNYIASQNTEVENIQTNSEKIADHNSTITGKLNQLNDFTTDQSIAVELISKQLIGKTDVSIEPYYTIHSGNIFEQDNFSSKTRAAGVVFKVRLK